MTEETTKWEITVWSEEDRYRWWYWKAKSATGLVKYDYHDSVAGWTGLSWPFLTRRAAKRAAKKFIKQTFEHKTPPGVKTHTFTLDIPKRCT